MLTKQEKELKQRYIDLTMKETWRNDAKMRKHFEQTIDRVVQMENGCLIALDKPRIQTRFCFGYSDSRYDTEDYDRANGMAHHARTNEDYFIEENMKQVDERINDLNNDRFVIYSRIHYYGAPAESLIHCLVFYRDYQKEWGEVPKECVELTDADRKALLAAYEDVKKDFSKRLQTYLKRYGLSKVDAWSYWRDE